MAKIQASPAFTPLDRSQARFLGLLKRDILKLDLADLDFGIYRILNYRRAQVLDYLDIALPGRISAWTDALAKSSGRELASTEAENCYYHLHTFFARYWDDGDFIPVPDAAAARLMPCPVTGKTRTFTGPPRAATASRAANSLPAMPTKTALMKCASPWSVPKSKKTTPKAAPSTSFQPM
jgi:adenine-specific DNA-methyltransferase